MNQIELKLQQKELERCESEVAKLQAETRKLLTEQIYLTAQNDREDWRIILYGIATAGGVIAVLLAVTKLGAGL